MTALFGPLYSGIPSFRHDTRMAQQRGLQIASKTDDEGRTSYININEDPEGARSSKDHHNKGRRKHSEPRHPAEALRLYSAERTNDGRRPQQWYEEEQRGDGNRDIERDPHGNFWPPRDIDHYSPPRRRKRSRSPLRTVAPESRHKCNKVPDQRWSPFTPVARSLTPPLRDRWLRHIADARTDEDPLSDRIHEGDQVSECSVVVESSPSPWQEEGKVEFGNQELPGMGHPSVRSSAFRNEAYQAVKNESHLTWSDIGLVSVGGHQMKEEEL